MDRNHTNSRGGAETGKKKHTKRNNNRNRDTEMGQIHTLWMDKHQENTP